jgi:hypothetical protein
MPAAAGVPSVGECFEGAEFIANAARARDAGMKRAAFLDRMEEDFVAIRAFPEPLRWFVRDADDEQFLRESASRVFDAPEPPERHGATFLADCLPRTSRGQGRVPARRRRAR